jgi:hypothetical protein
MSRRNDDLFDTIEGDAMDDALATFVDELRGLAHGPVPAPSAELAALLGQWQLTAPRRRPSLSVLAAVAASVVIVVGGAAAQHALPEPAQSVVSHVVDRLTPFGLGTLDHPVLPPAGGQPQPVHHVGAPATRLKPTHSLPNKEPKQHATQHRATTPPVLAAAHPSVGPPGRGHRWNRHAEYDPRHHRQWSLHRAGRHHWTHPGLGHRHHSDHGGHDFGGHHHRGHHHGGHRHFGPHQS